jgi:hypothetical protein
MSLLLHKDRGQVPVVNSEEEEESPPSYLLREYPLGYVMLAQAKGIPESCPDLCRATENVVAPTPERIAAHHLEQGDHAASGLAASLGLLIRRSARGVSSRMPRSVSRGKRAPHVPDRLAPSRRVAVSVAVSPARDCFVPNPGQVTE